MNKNVTINDCCQYFTKKFLFVDTGYRFIVYMVSKLAPSLNLFVFGEVEKLLVNLLLKT
jgi:hypothetical protein